MYFTTVWSTSDRNQIIIIKTTLEQNSIKCRLRDTYVHKYFTMVSVQVPQKQQERAIEILRENGFFRNAGREEDVSIIRFWIYLALALIVIILAAIVINRVMPAANILS